MKVLRENCQFSKAVWIIKIHNYAFFIKIFLLL